MEYLKKSFRTNKNQTGSLSFLEGEHDLPFAIKRVYYIYNVIGNARRGFHAHKHLKQYLICVNGSCEVLLDDGQEQETVLLNIPNEGLYVGPRMWHEMYNFSDDAVLLVLASDYYDESDYIRDYQEFKNFVHNKGVVK